MIKNLMMMGLLVPLFGACSAEDPAMEESASNVTESNLNISADIVSSDLIGTWEIISMTSDVEVDLDDLDSEETTDLLNETACFNSMFFSFDANGKVITGQAKLDFSSKSNGFGCSSGEYEADYVAEGNELEVYFLLNGMKMSQKKTIGLSQDEFGKYLHVFLTETEAALYVNDPGNTVASEVGRVDMVFKKK